MRGAIPTLPHNSSWRNAYLSAGCVFVSWCLVKHRETFTFISVLV